MQGGGGAYPTLSAAGDLTFAAPQQDSRGQTYMPPPPAAPAPYGQPAYGYQAPPAYSYAAPAPAPYGQPAYGAPYGQPAYGAPYPAAPYQPPYQPPPAYMQPSPTLYSPDPGHGQRRRRAVLVGCSYPGTDAQLNGCLNDVKCMQYLLKSKLGFTDQGIVALKDDSRDPNFTSTKANIVRSIQVRRIPPGLTCFHTPHMYYCPPHTHSWLPPLTPPPQTQLTPTHMPLHVAHHSTLSGPAPTPPTHPHYTHS